MKLTRLYVRTKALSVAGLLSVLVVCSCNRDDIPKSNKFEIGFAQEATKSGLSDVQASGIKAHGIVNINGSNSAAIVNDKELTYTGASIWDYSPKSYWASGAWHYFYSWFPKSISPVVSNPSDGKTLLSLTYSLIRNNALNSDELLFWSGAVEATEANMQKPVGIALKHVLSRISFTIVVDEFADTDQIYIDNVILTGMTSSGEYLCQVTGSGSPFTVQEGWNANGMAYSGTLFSSGVINTAIPHNTTGSKVIDNMYMIPQAVDAAIVAEIRYHVVDNGGQRTDFTKSISLDNAQATEWLSGNTYNYKLTLTPNYITFGTITVATWNSLEQSGGIIVR